MANDAKVAVRRYFDDDVAGYGEVYRAGRPGDSRRDVFHERRDLVLEMTPGGAQRVLDIGSGPGVFARQLLARGGRCWIVDLSYEMIAAASRDVADRGGRACFMVGDLDQLPFADRSMDAAVCVGVLQYLPSLDFAFAELARVVVPGGHVVLTYPNSRSPLNMLHRVALGAARPVQAALARAGLASAPDPSRLTFRRDIPNRSFSTRDIGRRARASGFALEEVRYHVFQFPFRVPGLGFLLGGWNRLVRGWLPRGPVAAWGREAVVRLRRVA